MKTTADVYPELLKAAYGIVLTISEVSTIMTYIQSASIDNKESPLISSNYSEQSFTAEFRCFDSDITKIGTGLLGGKVESLAVVSQALHIAAIKCNTLSNVYVPHMYVIATDYFDTFMNMNGLNGRDFSKYTDMEIAEIFADAQLPGSLIGAFYTILEKVHNPIAVRSSGLIETDLYRSIAAPYGARILSNSNQDDVTRILELRRAVKAIWASSFFQRSREFVTNHNTEVNKTKTAVFIQEIIGRKTDRLFYPDLSGRIVSPPRKRSFNHKTVPIIESVPGIIWKDNSGLSCSTNESVKGFGAVNLDSPYKVDDMTGTNCCLTQIENADMHNSCDVSLLPIEEIVKIAEKTLGGRRAEIRFASMFNSLDINSTKTAILKIVPADSE